MRLLVDESSMNTWPVREGVCLALQIAVSFECGAKTSYVPALFTWVRRSLSLFYYGAETAKTGHVGRESTSAPSRFELHILDALLGRSSIVLPTTKQDTTPMPFLGSFLSSLCYKSQTVCIVPWSFSPTSLFQMTPSIARPSKLFQSSQTSMVPAMRCLPNINPQI